MSSGSFPHSSSPVQWITVDGDDPSIQYDGDWFAVSDITSYRRLTNHEGPYFGTLRGTSHIPGLSFFYTGSNVLVLGTLSCASGTTWECFLDGKGISKRAWIADATTCYNNQALCHWEGATGSHTLTLNVTRIPSGQTLLVDQIHYLPFPASHQGNEERTPLRLAHPLVQNESTTISERDVPSLFAATPTTSNPPKNRAPVVAILGGVLGGMALIGVTLLLFYLYRRRRPRLKEEGVVERATGHERGSNPHPQSFSAEHSSSTTNLLPLQPSRSILDPQPERFPNPTSTPVPAVGPTPLRPQLASIPTQELGVPIGSSSSGSNSRASLSDSDSGLGSPVMLHENSGLRFPPGLGPPQRVVDMPPAYSVA